MRCGTTIKTVSHMTLPLPLGTTIKTVSHMTLPLPLGTTIKTVGQSLQRATSYPDLPLSLEA